MKCLIGFLATLKCLTLNDFEMPFYAKKIFRHRFDQIFLPWFQRQLWKSSHADRDRNVRQGL